MIETNSAAIELAKVLISRKSITPEDDDCQKIIAQRLSNLGFSVENLPFDNVSNLWARRGKKGPLFLFAGHTDVVPTGPIEEWRIPPFAPEEKDGYLWGRGSCDMKSAIASMIIACEKFIAKYPGHPGSIAFLLTSDEEGIAINGTNKVIELLKSRQEQIDWCIVGEPTCTNKLGDTIKNGRRGSLIGDLVIHGVQGHVAYPHLASNPIHLFSPILSELCQKEWDKGNEYFQPTSFQISNVNAGTGAENVIPDDLKIKFNFRFSSELTVDNLKNTFEAILKKHKIKYDIQWRLSGNPFLTKKGKLVTALGQAIKKTVGLDPELSTSGGTSDGRFIATTGCEVIEFGLINATIHKINECAAVADIVSLAEIYKQTLENLLLV